MLQDRAINQLTRLRIKTEHDESRKKDRLSLSKHNNARFFTRSYRLLLPIATLKYCLLLL